MKRNFFFAILFLIVLTGWASSLSTPAQQKTKSVTEQSKKKKETNDSPWSILGIY